MRTQKYTISIYDMLSDKMILKNGNFHDVERLLGINCYNLSYYIKGKPYKGRYVLSTTEIEREKPKAKPDFMDKQFHKEDLEIMKLFNETMQYLKENYPSERLKNIVFVCKAA